MPCPTFHTIGGDLGRGAFTRSGSPSRSILAFGVTFSSGGDSLGQAAS